MRLTNEHSLHVLPKGKPVESRGTAGTVASDNRIGSYWHTPENPDDKAMELIFNERKLTKR